MTAAPDVVGAVVGWRRWLLEDGWVAPRLVSPVAHAVWHPRAERVAHCRFGRHDAPARDCGCGLWAVADLSSLLGAFSRGEVVGCAALWGRVVVAERGWRGERGTPGPLFVGPQVRERARRLLAARYGVAVHRLPAPFEALVVADRARLETLARAVREEVEAVTAGRIPHPDAAVAAFLAAADDLADAAVARDRRRPRPGARGRAVAARR